ncbi:MAG: LysE family transporter, partial [Woeseiaceae bacterium]
MDAWIAIAGILIVAFITPGPNNFLVLEAAARRGLLAALPVVAAVNLGGILLLALTWSGAGAAFDAIPQLAGLFAIAGGAYLAGLGA